MEDTKELITEDDIRNKVYIIRKRLIFDRICF